MTSLKIDGGASLNGDIFIQGSKNAALPILAGTLLNKGQVKLLSCPAISDVYQMVEILKQMGCEVTWEENQLCVDTTYASYRQVTNECAGQMRSSVFLMGALLGRFGEFSLPYPGGCAIGSRPVDIHLEAMKLMGVSIREDEAGIYGCTTGLKGAYIPLRYPSVGATENIILAAVLAEGNTFVENAACEPEIVDLCLMLNKMGGRIHGMGTKNISIEGVKELHDVSFNISADRIVAATYLSAAAITCGNVGVMNIWEHDIKSVLQVLAQMGCGIVVHNKRVRVIGPQVISPVDHISTRPFPGFPTDMQSQLMTCLSIAKGVSHIHEKIFENRFRIVPQLRKMGANIVVKEREAVITGVEQLTGTTVAAKDLRGGAALVIAGLISEGTTTIENPAYIQRGYEDIARDLNALGASITAVA